jgi:hypothetical protein
MSEDNRPHLGHGIVGLLQGLKAAIESGTGINVYMEPTPVRAQKTSVLIMPRTISFRSEGEARDGRHITYTAMLDLELVLNGEGSGSEFLAEALEGSFNLGLFLDVPMSIEYGPGMYASLSATRSKQGKFFESEEEGSMFHVYEEQWAATLYFPFLAEKQQGTRLVSQDELMTINMG